MPTIGEEFWLYSDSRHWAGLHPTYVQSIFEVGSESGWDKVVLPQGFPAPEHLDLSFGTPKAGDLLFATRNSLYWLTDIEEVPVPKSQRL